MKRCIKLSKKYFGGCLRATKTILEDFGGLKIFFGFFFTSYYIVWTLSFSETPHFLFYNDFKGFYETFRKNGKNLGILYNKICPNIRFLRGPWDCTSRAARAPKKFLGVPVGSHNGKNLQAT